MNNSMLKDMNRISIIGGPGTGKSTLANNIGKELNLPIYHLDAIHHLENWKVRDCVERDKIILEKIEEERWVIDGTYKSTLEARVKKSDMVIFLNYSTIARVRSVLSRYFKNKGKERPEIPGCKEQMNWKFLKLVIKWEQGRINIINETLEKNKDKNIIIFKNRRKLNKWYKKEFGKIIEV